MKNVVAYYRLARADQEEGGIAQQREAVLEFAKENSLLITKEFVDNGVSGLTADRPGLNDLIFHIENDAAQTMDAVIVSDIARIGRSIEILRGFSVIMNRFNKELIVVK